VGRKRESTFLDFCLFRLSLGGGRECPQRWALTKGSSSKMSLPTLVSKSGVGGLPCLTASPLVCEMEEETPSLLLLPGLFPSSRCGSNTSYSASEGLWRQGRARSLVRAHTPLGERGRR